MEISGASDAQHHFGGTYTAALVGYLQDTFGPACLAEVIDRCGDTRSVDVLADTAGWSSYDEFRRLLESAAAVLGGPQELTVVGRCLFDLADFERSPAAVHALGSPEALYANAAAAQGMICPIVRSDPQEISQREWLITQTFAEGFEPFAEHCALQVGVQQFTTMIFGYPPATVVEEQCVCRGDSACVFRICWEAVDEAERRREFLDGRVQTLEAMLKRFESTVADLVSGPDLQTVVSRTFASASRALQAPIYVLALRQAPQSLAPVYYTGVSQAEAESLAADLLAHKDRDFPECLTVDVASMRSAYGRLAAVRPGGGFLPGEEQTLQAYASFLAAALDSAAAVDEAHRQEEEARRQRDTAHALLELSTALAEVTSVQEMAAKLVRAVPRVMGCDRALVLIPDHEDKLRARVAATHGYPSAIARRLREQTVPLPPQQAGHPEFNRRSVPTSGDLPATYLFETGTTANTIIPIIVDGEWAGAIVAGVVRDPERLEPSVENENRLRSLAAQAATAIRNARLLDQVRHQALHDPLTGLPNRALILDRADQMLARARRNKRSSAALFIYLDGFKDINDTFGHATGDELLRAVTSRLTATLRPSDTVGRLGGDEFVVLVDGVSLDAGPELVAERILAVMREPFQLADQRHGSLPVTASIGIATGDRIDAGELLRDADIALYQAKAAGKDRYRVFEAQMQTTIQERLLLQLQLRAALQQQQFSVVYQPICHLSSGAITGVEALLRWNHPTRGQIEPDEFIPLLEETGLILEVGRWVLNEACQQAAQWHQQGLVIDMAVNVSGRQLQTSSFLFDIQDALGRSQLNPHALTIEITESTMMVNPSSAAERLSAIRALGVRIAIDDFGTGYSSLAVLRDFPVDILKIDRAFISKLSESGESNALIHTFVQLGKTLGLTTLAEGIESAGQYTQLQNQDCESGQGFLIARPMPARDLEDFLQARQRSRLTAGTGAQHLIS